MLVYPSFLRIAITSCRMQVSDTELTDNHWYIHDLPILPGRNTDSMSNFESGLLDHLQALGTPQRLIDSIKIHLITFVPGEHKGAKADRHGLLRLWSVTGDLGLDLVRITASRELWFEICASYIGSDAGRVRVLLVRGILHNVQFIPVEAR